MPQCFALDKARRISYYGLAGLLVLGLGCVHGIKSIAPAGLEPVERSSIRQWLEPYAPATPKRYDLHWKYRNSRGAAGGRAAVRVAPRDSLRFDFRGPLGKSGAAVVIGDSGLWSKPEGNFQDVLQAAPLLWAALGMPREPGKNYQLSALNTPQHRAWRYAGASDTFDFVEVRERPVRLLAEMRRGGRIVGLAEARFNEAGTQVVSSQLDFPREESRFSFTVDSVTQVEAFDPETWRRP
jgi:hypothetical protein